MADRSPDHEQDRPEPAEHRSPLITRKNLLKAAVAAIPATAIAAGAVPALARNRADAATTLEPTPFCGDGDEETPPQIEGPYFKPNSPLRTSLREDGMPGTLLTVSGYVFGRTCQPLSGVLLDFWQADDSGTYDMTGFTLRGHQLTGDDGSYRLETIVPGLYPGRTRHIHVKGQAPGEPILTTQLYFPNEPRNNTDAYFDPRLLMNVRSAGDGEEATFDFVLDVAGGGPTASPTSTSAPGGRWAEGASYQAGDVVTLGGTKYRCRQAHTAYTGWLPPTVPALWQPI